MLPNPKHLKHNGILLMILASLFFSIMGGLAKYAMVRVPFMEAVFFRALITFILLLPYMKLKKISLFGKNRWLLFLRSTSGFIALSLSFYVTSQIKLADASILNHTSTLFVAILSIFFLKEKVKTPLIIYIICALVGAALIIKPGFKVVNFPGLMGLLSGFFAAVAYISIKKLHDTESFFTMVFNFCLISALGSLLIAGQHFVKPHFWEMLALIGLGLTGTLAQLLMTYAYKYTDASIVSPYAFSAVIFSALWGGIFWNEIPDQWSIAGGLLIIACGIGIMKLRTKKEKIKRSAYESTHTLPGSGF